jgi:hypothetical protein
MTTSTAAPTAPAQNDSSTTTPPISPVDQENPGLAVANAVSASLVRRGFLTTEWFTTIIALALTALLAWLGVGDSMATQIVGVAAPTILAAVYALVRTRQKSAQWQLVSDVFPHFDQPLQP